MTRFNIGDEVHWDGGPNEFRDNRSGTIINIKGNIAYIDDMRSTKKVRKVPLKILTKIER